MSSSNYHENLTERALRLPGKKKSHKSSWDKAKAREAEQMEEQRRATDSAELTNDMHKFLEELRNRRKRPSIIDTIRGLFT